MALIDWNDSFSVNVKQLDDQHKQVIGMINDLHAAMQSGKGRQEVGEIINKMIEYTRLHFSTEEKVLSANGYPAYNDQKEAHDAFTQRVLDFQQQYQQSNLVLSLQVIGFLKEWWTGHILGEDRKYTAFLNEKGIR